MGKNKEKYRVTVNRYPAAPKYDIDNIIGKSEAVQVLKMEIIAAARTASSVLIKGEPAGSFVRVNCSAIPENLMESEFFGYEGGAFTGVGGKIAGHFPQYALRQIKKI